MRRGTGTGIVVGAVSGMELVFLGTGAAEGSPAAYCRCATCQEVRRCGGPDLRTRSSLRAGPHHQIDLSPDTSPQTFAAGLDLYDVEHVLVTHTHEDHFTPSALLDKRMSRETNGRPLSVYLSGPGRTYVERMMACVPFSSEDRRWIDANLALVGLEYFREYTVGGLTVQTVRGSHAARGVGEQSVNYLVGTPEGRRFLYACDTGYYRDETWEYLAGKRVDVLILECTFAGLAGREEFPDSHLDLASWFRMLERMARIGFVDGTTAVFATHFNPHQGLDHAGIDDRLRRSLWHATAARDGLRVEV